MKHEHNNISPLDNRYAEKIADTRVCFSEHELVKQRFNIELEWLIYLCDNYPNFFKKLSQSSRNKIYKLKDQFADKDVLKIKKIEATTNHDVKAVEYFIKDFFKKDKVLSGYIHLIHFGLTSEDINSLAYSIMIKNGLSIHIKKLSELLKILKTCSVKWKNIAFLSRTHGQAASPVNTWKRIKSVFEENRKEN
jgi:adenylosuccinate lyase